MLVIGCFYLFGFSVSLCNCVIQRKSWWITTIESIFSGILLAGTGLFDCHLIFLSSIVSGRFLWAAMGITILIGNVSILLFEVVSRSRMIVQDGPLATRWFVVDLIARFVLFWALVILCGITSIRIALILTGIIEGEVNAADLIGTCLGLVWSAIATPKLLTIRETLNRL